MTTSQLLDSIIQKSMAFSPENLYQIKADTRENSDDFKRFQAAYPQGSAFWSFLSYNPGPNPFREFRRHVRIVAHLRRGDISGKLLFDEAGREAMLASNPEKMRGTHFRNLLTIEDVVSDIEHRYPDQEIALFVSSDGVSRLKRKFAGFQETVEKIDAMERDLHETPCQLPQQVTFVGSAIGTDERSTRESLDAMAWADCIYTQSSSFASLISRTRDVQVIKLLQAPKGEPPIRA